MFDKKLVVISFLSLIFHYSGNKAFGQVTLTNQWLISNGLSSNAGYVVIKNKNIQSIDGNAFNGYSNTFTLNLANNRIGQLGAGLFDGMSKLGVFDLSYNQITSVDGGLFRNLVQLVTINLEANQISSLADGTFNGLVKLRNLFLTRNRLTRISASLLTGKNIYFLNRLIEIFVLNLKFLKD